MTVDLIAAGRRAYAQHAWADAHDAFTQASASGPLGADDTERWAWAGFLTGRDDSFAALERVYDLRLEAGENLRAARTAIWLGLRLMSMRQIGHATGWLARGRRLAPEVLSNGEVCASATDGGWWRWWLSPS